MKHLFHFFLFAFSILVFSNCSTAYKIKPVTAPGEFQTSPISKNSPDSSFSMKGKKLSLPGKVRNVEYDPKAAKVLVFYQYEWKKYFSCYDLKEEKLLWTGKGNPGAFFLSPGIVMAREGGNSGLIDANTGNFIREPGFDLFLALSDSITLKLGKNFSGIGLKTGIEYWSKPGKFLDGYQWDKEEDWIYLMADGLYAIHPKNGKGWRLPANTSYVKNRHIAVNTLLFIANIIAINTDLGTEFGYLESTISEHSYAGPVADGDSLYFAARKDVFCLNKEDGAVFWKQNLPDDVGALDFSLLSNNQLFLVGKGYHFTNYGRKKVGAPTIFLLDSNNGKIIKSQVLPTKDWVLDYTFNDGWYYLISDDKLIQYDKKLEKARIFDLLENNGKFLRILTWSTSDFDSLTADNQLVYPLTFRTSKGILALHPKTLEILYFKELPISPPPNTFGRSDFFALSEYENSLSWVDEETDIFWMPSDVGLVGVDLLNNGERVWRIPMKNGEYLLAPNGEVMEMSGNAVRIFRVESN